MKWFHNEKVSLAWAVLVEVAVHALFAFQAFLLSGFLGEIALTVVFGPAGAQIGAWALAIFIFGAAFQAFVLGEYMREHVEAFESTAKGNGSYIKSWKHLRWLVGGIEISSLAFRCYTILAQGNVIQAVIVCAMGLIALWYAFAQAKVIHASVNRPVEYDVLHARNQAGRDLIDSSLKLLPGMTVDQKRRFYTGDMSAVDEAYESEQARRNEKLRPKEERKEKQRQQEESRREGMRHAGDYVRKLLGGNPEQEAETPTPFRQAARK